MTVNLLTIFFNVDFQKVGKLRSNITSLVSTTNKSNGAKVARAVLDNGTTLIITVTSTGGGGNSSYDGRNMF